MHHIESNQLTMAHFQNVAICLAVCVLAVSLAQSPQGGPHTSQGGPNTSQGGPHQNQGRSRRQAEIGTFDITQSVANWTTCNYLVDPKISCHDCHTRMICKPIGGLLKNCDEPSRPYCNNGICSPVPSVQCA
ncbi:hypothetical protein SFRURICE_005693 [Spodoptera frugiperda]|uniref:SFRICE_002268 n=1 Tax=Spodoptera frugiperda TaxID=7108 RepID=A0A2H1W9S7_SPOFR|nr:hypothetical protein SFRURICE_005693 [Spodoptera frugiperda]